MFLSGACANRILKTVLPDITLSSMGLMDLNNGILSFLTKITNNIAPLVEMNSSEVELALPKFLPENLIESAKKAASEAEKKFTESGSHISKCVEPEFPLEDLLTRVRDAYHSVIVNENSIVYMAACIEVAVAEFLRVAGEHAKSQNRNQISRNDVKWTLSNDFEIGPCFQD